MAENKIIVDEDWKAQVQAEKEAATQAPPADQPAAEAAADQPGADEPMPPASLSYLIMSLSTQAWFALGQIPDPRTGKAEVHLPYARHTIDTLEVLEQKTQGNRSPEEIALLSRTLHELRMAYVSVQREKQ